MDIREIKLDEVEKVQKIVEQILHESFPEYDPKIKDAIIQKELIIAEKVAVSDVFTVWATFNPEPLAYLIAIKPIGGVTNVQWLGVISEEQGKGIGAALLNKYLAWARDHHAYVAHLLSAEHNLPFYQKQGFENAGRAVPSYWGGKDHLMVKVLRESREDDF